MEILIFKTIHIVGFTSWFAGLFYLIRIMVYHTEALDLNEPDASVLSRQFGLMEQRVYKIICNPAMMLTWMAGIVMIYLYGLEWLKENPWLHIKLLLLVLLTVYHLYCKKLMIQLSEGKRTFTSFQMRLLNEVPAVFLIIIVILAVFKTLTNVFYALGITVLIILLLILFAKAYKRHREKSKLNTK